MTSREPDTKPPGTTGPPGRPGRASGQRGLARMLPLTLLIILGLAGLRGAVTEPRWNGPMHRDGVVIGLALEAVLLVLLVITLRRQSAGRDAGTLALAVHGAPANVVAAKLRTALIFVLVAGMAAVATILIIGLHLHLFTVKPRTVHRPGHPTPTPLISPPPPRERLPSSTLHVSAATLLYALLIVVLVAAVAISVWWARRLRPSFRPRPDDFIAEDSQDLREAVASGRSALRTIDDARAAIIACYLAMESSLAERGAARAVADTPDELLARATATGIVRGTAASRLTALFYEARFSSHPLNRGQRDAAELALDELAASLAEAEAAT